MKDLKKKSTDDLKKMLKEQRALLRDFRFKNSGSHVRNVKEGRALRLKIAHILTELNTREA